MKLPEMKTGLAISASCHAALLLWGLLSFAAKPLEARPNDAMPVDIISDKQFSEITKGVKDGAKDKMLASLAEKIDTAKPVDDSRAKVTEKKVLDAARAEPPPPAEQQPPAPTETRLDKKEPPKIDDIASIVSLEAIEIYRGPSETPIAYQNTGSACGVVLLWTRTGEKG